MTATDRARELAEEHGHGNELQSHKATFLQYLRALGATDLVEPCPAAVHAFNQALVSFCLQKDAPAGAAATSGAMYCHAFCTARKYR